MTYASVEDVPSSWEPYVAMARSLEQVAPRLLLHVAGPTDEGFRIIEVAAARTVVRRLRVVHQVIGEAWPTEAQNGRIVVGPGRVASPEHAGREGPR